MKHNVKVWAAAVAAVVGLPAAAQEAPQQQPAEVHTEAPPQEVHIPLSITVIPGISTNGLSSGNVVNNLSLGLVATHAGRVDGLAAAIGANWVNGRVRGLESAVGFNVAGGEVQGAQTAVGLNVAGAQLTGLQAAVGANIGAADVRGLQATVGANIAAGKVAGVQAAVGANVAAGDMVGLQTATGVSFARALQGAQVSLINVGGDVSGAQVGLLNIARKVTGMQLGLVNVAGEVHGAPIGLVSVAGNGQFHVQAWTSDVAMGNVGVKFGSKHLYTLLTAGYQPGGQDSRRWLTGLGLGGHIPLGAFYVDVDALASSLHAGVPFRTYDNANLLAQLRLMGGLELASHLSLFAGVTANSFINWNDRTFTGLGSRFAWEYTSRHGTSVRMWPGFVAGIQL